MGVGERESGSGGEREREKVSECIKTITTCIILMLSIVDM